MNIIGVGSSGFIARAVQNGPGADWLFLHHNEVPDNLQRMRQADCIVNFAFPPMFKTSAYTKDQDFDRWLALEIAGSPVHYMMLSSRLVYGRHSVPVAMTEQAKPQPSGFYATAKYMTEQELQSILGPHLTILRLANICGFEWGRESFFGRMQATLKQQSRIVFDMHPDSIRDFLPVEDCANMIAAIARQPVPGIFNAGSGFGTSCCKVAEWLMEGYGSGKLEVENDNRNDQFWLDMSKTATTFNAPAIAPEALRQRCLSYGERLRQNVAV